MAVPYLYEGLKETKLYGDISKDLGGDRPEGLVLHWPA